MKLKVLEMSCEPRKWTLWDCHRPLHEVNGRLGPVRSADYSTCAACALWPPRDLVVAISVHVADRGHGDAEGVPIVLAGGIDEEVRRDWCRDSGMRGGDEDEYQREA